MKRLSGRQSDQATCGIAPLISNPILIRLAAVCLRSSTTARKGPSRGVLPLPTVLRAVPARTGGKGSTPLVGPLRAVVDERRQAAARRISIGLLISGAMPHVAWSDCLPLRRFMCGLCTVTRHPVTHRPGICTVIPRWREVLWPQSYSTQYTCLIHKISVALSSEALRQVA